MPKGGPRRSGRSAKTGRRVEPEPLAERIGGRVRDLRKEAGITFVELVAETELGAGYLSELERGLVVPGAVALDRIARGLGVALCDLVAFPEDDSRQRLLDLTRQLEKDVLDRLVRAAEDALPAEEADRSTAKPRSRKRSGRG